MGHWWTLAPTSSNWENAIREANENGAQLIVAYTTKRNMGYT